MYGIFTYIYHKNQPNVGEYTIHGSSWSWHWIWVICHNAWVFGLAIYQSLHTNLCYTLTFQTLVIYQPFHNLVSPNISVLPSKWSSPCICYGWRENLPLQNSHKLRWPGFLQFRYQRNSRSLRIQTLEKDSLVFSIIWSRKSTPHKDEELNLFACTSYPKKREVRHVSLQPKIRTRNPYLQQVFLLPQDPTGGV